MFIEELNNRGTFVVMKLSNGDWAYSEDVTFEVGEQLKYENIRWTRKNGKWWIQRKTVKQRELI